MDKLFNMDFRLLTKVNKELVSVVSVSATDITVADMVPPYGTKLTTAIELAHSYAAEIPPPTEQEDQLTLPLLARLLCLLQNDEIRVSRCVSITHSNGEKTLSFRIKEVRS